MFIRVFIKRREVLLNTAFISKIEVEYGVQTGENEYADVSPDAAADTPDAIRFYRVHCSGEVLFLMSNPGDPVTKHIEEIYKNAVKA